MTDGPLAGRRILLVEDEMLVCMLLEDMLADLGCRVVGPAARLDQALRLVEREAFDAAVLDVNLGGELSYPLADTLAARGLPFLFLTGYNRLRSAYGALPWLRKPVEQRHLAAGIAALLDSR